MRAAALLVAFVLAACEFEVFGTEVRIGSDQPGAGVALTPNDLPAFFDCLRDNDQAVVSAHRGGPAPGYAENAIATFEHTLTTKGPAFLEVDVSRTRDGMLVLMHDDTVDRTTDGAGAVAGLTLTQFQALRLQDEDGATLDGHPPTLRQAMDWAERRAVLELDMKRGVSYEDVVGEVQAAGAMSRVVFITYSVDGASRVARLAPDAMIYTTIREAGELDTLEQRGVDLSRIVAWLGTEQADAELLNALAARGVEARVGRFGDGARGRFAQAASGDVRIIAADDVSGAVRELDAADGVHGRYGALLCVTAE